MAAVSAAVAIACLLNPYGVRGAFFPLELYPKISDPANPYKVYVDEFTSLRMVVLDRMGAAPGAHAHVRAQVFLLLMLPWSFVLPAAWKKWRSSLERSGQAGCPLRFPGGVLVMACVLALTAVLGVPLPGTPRWLVAISRASPVIMLLAGTGAAFNLAVRSRAASATMAVGSAAVAAWTAWLFAYLFDGGATHFGLSTGILAYLGAWARRLDHCACRPRGRQRLPLVARGRLHIPFVSGGPQHQSFRPRRRGGVGVERRRMACRAGRGAAA